VPELIRAVEADPKEYLLGIYIRKQQPGQMPLVHATDFFVYQSQVLNGAARKTMGAEAPLQEALRVTLGVERRLVRLSQHEGVVDSEGAELLAVSQEKAEVLPRKGHQLQRYRDAGLRHVILQSAGRQLEAGRAGAAFEDQVAWRKSIVLTAPVARSDCRKAGTLRALAASLDEQDGVAERDRLRRDATRIKNELVAAYSWDDRAVATGLGART